MIDGDWFQVFTDGVNKFCVFMEAMRELMGWLRI